MKRAFLAVFGSISLAAVAGCSDPECASNEVKIGVTCYPKRADSGLRDAAGPDDPGGKMRFDASVDTDGAFRPDAREPVQAVDDSGAALGSLDATMSMTELSQCGDGKVTGGEVCDRAIAAGQPGACQTAATCTATDKCLVAKLSGDSETCSARCETEPLAVCMSGDGCCPTKCTPANDGECSTGCGDGFVDAAKGETCEGAGCPSSCDDHDACTADKLIGSASNCNAACTAPAIAADHTKKDSCCPSGANAGSDLDCAGCGNGVVEAGEQCDGNCPTSCDDGNPCTVDSLQGAGCSVACAHNPVTAPAADGCCVAGENHKTESACPARCGDGVVETPEQCDPPAAACSAACQWQDIASTLGDDRPGYVRCGDTTCGPGVACEHAKMLVPGTSNYSDVYTCTNAFSGSPSTVCDGPEDCPPDYACGQGGGPDGESTSYGCLGKTTFVIHVSYCHGLGDCAAGLACLTGVDFAHIGECKSP